MTDTKTIEHPSLAAALAAFQAEVPTIKKSNEAEVEKNGAFVYSYQYADLSDINEVVLPLLGKHGMAWTSQPTMLDDMFVLHYELKHESGESIEGIYPLPSWTTPAQQLGSAITYARRYALTAVTGVAPGGDDDDAQSAPAAAKPAPEQKTAPARTRKPAVKKATVDWAAQIIDANTVEDLRAVAQLVEDKGEVGMQFGPEHAEHVVRLVQFYDLPTPPETITVGQMLAVVKAEIIKRDEAAPEPEPEPAAAPDEQAMALDEGMQWETAVPGQGATS